jgi:hypothetical protein
MAQREETCPWCQKKVLVEVGRRSHNCPYCKNNFTSESQSRPPAPPAEAPAAPSQANAARSLGFVETPFIKDLVGRALAYLEDGLHVHLSGPAGGGKTTIASTWPS